MSLIKQLYESDKDTLIELIKNEGVDLRDIPNLYELLNSNDNEIIFSIYKLLDENPKYLNIELLSEKTGVDVFTLSKIFREKPIKVFFPIANYEEAQLATAYIFKLNKKTQKNSFSNFPGLSKIKSFVQTLKEKDFEDFFVIFDKNFKGESYLFSILAGLFLPQELLENFAFTGIVNEEGEIVEVDFLPQKEEVCKQKGLKLITPDLISSFEELKFYFLSDEVNIPFIILNKSDEECVKSLKKLENSIKEKFPYYSLDKVLSIYDLSFQDLYVNVENLPPEKKVWEEKLDEIVKKLKKVYLLPTTSKITLNIATSISSLSFAVGIVLGAKRSYRLYHFQNDKYHLMIDLSTVDGVRKIKQVKGDIYTNSNCIKVEVSINPEEKEANFILYTASHNPVADVKSYSKRDSYIYISDKNFQGTIPVDAKLWVEYVSEIYSVLNKVKEEHPIDKFHFFVSSPTVMAMAFGMAVGEFIKFDVYNYYKFLPEKYFKVFDSLELRTVF